MHAQHLTSIYVCVCVCVYNRTQIYNILHIIEQKYIIEQNGKDQRTLHRVNVKILFETFVCVLV